MGAHEDGDGAVTLVCETQLRQLFGRPAATSGWLTDHDPTARAHQFRRDSKGLRRGAEAARRHRVEPLTRLHQDSRVGPANRHAVTESQRGHRPFEEIGALSSPVDEGDREVHPIGGHHQPRDASPTADVDRGRTSRRWTDLGQRSNERPGVLDDVFDRPRTEQAEALRGPQHVEQFADRLGPAAADVQDRVTTTRRVGSSPSE